VDRLSTEAAVRAALAAARDHGLPTGDPIVVRDLTNVLVRLAPAPVVARVPLTLSLLRGRDWYGTEVQLGSWLARESAPVAAPAEAVDPGPHDHDGYLVSFWRYVDHDPARFDAVEAGRALRRLHDVLERYSGELPSFDRLEEVERLLARLEPSAAANADELDGLRHVAARLAICPRDFASRPIHGDAHFRNILWSPDGPLWTDLENACSGPVEFDLACLTWRAAPGTEEALAEYGSYDADVLEAVAPYLALFLAAWTIVVAERVPTDSGVAEARRRVARALA
jgi:aminoglycoside phosphotransferase (APT) family kinase protein